MRKEYPTVYLLQKEACNLTFTVKDSDGNTVDVSGATMALYAKRQLDDSTEYLFTRGDAAFTKNVGGDNYVCRVTINQEHTDLTGLAYGIVAFRNTPVTDVRKAVFKMYFTPSPEDGA